MVRVDFQRLAAVFSAPAQIFQGASPKIVALQVKYVGFRVGFANPRQGLAKQGTLSDPTTSRAHHRTRTPSRIAHGPNGLPLRRSL